MQKEQDRFGFIVSTNLNPLLESTELDFLERINSAGRRDSDALARSMLHDDPPEQQRDRRDHQKSTATDQNHFYGALHTKGSLVQIKRTAFTARSPFHSQQLSKH